MNRTIRPWELWRLGDWELDLWDLSLARKDRSPGVHNCWLTVFGGVRCSGCGRFSLGCRAHWFCGMCQACLESEE